MQQSVLMHNRLLWHFDLKKFRPNEVKRVKISLACVFAFMFIGWPLIIYKTGIIGWVKFWLMPWLGYHFWVTSFFWFKNLIVLLVTVVYRLTVVSIKITFYFLLR